MKHDVKTPCFYKLNGLSLSRPALPVHIFAIFCILSPFSAQASPQDAIRLILDENWPQARIETMRTGNPALFKFYEWALYQEDLTNLPFDRISSFIRQNPNWPDQKKLLITAEKNMPDSLSAQETLDWLTAYPPKTGEGIERFLRASIATGQTAKALPLVEESWPSATMTQETQLNIMSQYGRSIPQKAHEARLDFLLKNQSYTLARSLADQLGNGYKPLVEARIALIEDKRNAMDLLYLVPRHLSKNTGLVFDHVRWLRENNNNLSAISLLNSIPLANSMTFPEDWWKERNILARRMIEDRNFAKAYQLASRHQTSSGTEYAEAEWLSGWLALRFLNQPDEAYRHFTQMYAKVETSISKARGAYWAGRASEALGKPQEAKTWFYQAASYPHTYYGQIALKHLKLSPPTLTPAVSTPADHTSITMSDLVQVAVLLHQAGEESLSAKFINARLETISTEGEYQAFSTYLKKLGDVSGAYRVAKRASWKNIYLGNASYPSLMTWVGDISIDPALAHGIIRQESQFDTTATSPAGALGLMQLMPATAREVARKRGWPHETSWLTARPEHNILLGSAYLNDLLKRFNGSYPLAIAAYNAGPSRVKGWLEAFGDPRTGEVNWIDWLELIPVAETRNYVQRVSEGVVTYRDHLGMVKK